MEEIKMMKSTKMKLTTTEKPVPKKMIAGGQAYVQQIIDRMSDEEIERGLHFFRRVSEIVDALRNE